MKTLTLCDLAGKSKKELVAHLKDSWRATDEQLDGVEILVAYESVGSWGCDSSGFFLLRKGRQLFEVHGSHCSCYGFEDQFKPEPTTRKYLRSDKFYMSTGGYDGTSKTRAAISIALVVWLARRSGELLNSRPTLSSRRPVTKSDFKSPAKLLRRLAFPKPTPQKSPLKTDARWRKAIQHLREAGKITDTPADIGLLMKEIKADIEREEADSVKEALFKHFWPQIARGTTAGFPEFYKKELGILT